MRIKFADYAVWRDNLGAADLEFNRDPNNMGAVDQDDYNSWVTNFGNTIGAGAAAAIPEPATCLLAALALVGMLDLRRQSR